MHKMTLIASHLERGNVLLCCMQVVKMAGSPVGIMCSEIANMNDEHTTGCDWVFKSKKGSSDYHDEMNATSFEEWFVEKLLPALPPNTLIVMDNASYHRYWVILLEVLTAGCCCSRHLEQLPSQKWKKAELKEWLDKNGNCFSCELFGDFCDIYAIGIPYPEKALKKDIWEIVKDSKPSPIYATDEIAKEKGMQLNGIDKE